MRRLATVLAATLLVPLATAAPALAQASGQGWYGEANDKVVTNAGYILIGFFPLFIFVMSLIQWRLDKRKEARKAAAKARAKSADWHGDW
jgi:hypothetical protein